MKLANILRNVIEDSTFLNFYQDLLHSAKPEQSGDVYLRPSMLPVCSMTLYLGMLLHRHNARINVDYFGSYFTSVGTALHENAQSIHSYASKQGYRVWGNWHCPECQRKWKHSCRNRCVCGTRAVYDEISLSAYGFVGHIDCILLTPKGVLVCDYKTTTSRNTEKEFPQLNVAYSLQILTYCLMLDKVWGSYFKNMNYGKVYAGSLLFISRDNPARTKSVTFDFLAMKSQVRAMTKTSVRQYASALKTLKTGNLKHIMATKSCKDRLDYLNNTKPYHKYCDCPLFDVCWKKSSVQDYISDIIPCKVTYD